MGDALVWWITVEVLGLVALPLAAVVLGRLPDRGYTAAKVLGLLLTGWLAYILAMSGLVPFGRGLLAGCLLVVAALSAWLLLRRDRALLADLRAHFGVPAGLRYVLTAEVLFTLAYAVWAFLRAYNPDVDGVGEKFMDFGFLNAILRSGTFPPHDMWLAGASINYYYFGYVLLAGLTSLSGVRNAVAFNLADATLLALTALGAFGVVYNLIAGTILRQYVTPRMARRVRAGAGLQTGQEEVAGAPARVTSRSGVLVRPARSQGAASAEAPTEVATLTEPSADADGAGGNGHSAATLPPASTRAPEPVPPEPGLAALPRLAPYLSPYLFALLAALMVVAMGNLTTVFAVHNGSTDEGNGWRFCFLCQTPQAYDWFAPSRIIQDYQTGPNGTKEKVGYETINEFPAFSFLLGDLHPHVLALPLVLLVVAFALALVRRRVLRATRWRDGLPADGAGWLVLAVAGIAAGALYTANTWDYPTYLLVLLAGLALPYLGAGRRAGWAWLRPLIVEAAILVAWSLLAFLPFQLTFKSLVGGQAGAVSASVTGIPVLGWVLQKLSSLLLINTADKTILGFLVIFGVFVLAIAGWLLYELIAYLARRAQADPEAGRLGWYWAGFGVLVLGAALLLRFPLLGLLLPMGVVALYLVWQQPGRPERNLALVLVAVGAFLGLAIEVVFLRDNFQMRMNTLFKFYFQIWLLWSLAAAYGLWRTLHAGWSARRSAVASRAETPARWPALAWVWAAGVAILVLSGLPYPVYGSASRQIGNQPAPRGLDGTAWLQTAAPGDYAAINWLRDNAPSNAVVLEAGADEYSRPGRVSSYTGIPTLVAWDNSHEALWRTNQPDLLAEISARRHVVDSIYSGTDPQTSQPLTAQRLLDLLHQYHVTYAFAGAVERGVPGFASTRPQELMTPYAEGLFKQALPVAFQSGTTVVYGVSDGIAGTGIAPTPPVAAATPSATPAPGDPVDPGAPPGGLFDAGPASAHPGRFNLPRGIARDKAGNFYVADTQNERIEKFDPTGKFLAVFGSKGSADGQFAPINDTGVGTGPGGVAVDAAGNIYVADTWNHRVQKFDATGAFLTTWGTFLNLADPGATDPAAQKQGFYGPRGVAIGPNGQVYVTDTGNKRVLIFDANGAYQREINSGMSPSRSAPDYAFDKPGELNEPIGLAVDGAGNVYVADTNNGRIQKFDPAGRPAAQWPVPAGRWAPGPYLEPFLALDSAGNVYATAPTGKSVLKFSPTGTLLGESHGPSGAPLQLPTGIAVDPDGTVYVVDTNANRVVKLGAIP